MTRLDFIEWIVNRGRYKPEQSQMVKEKELNCQWLSKLLHFD